MAGRVSSAISALARRVTRCAAFGENKARDNGIGQRTAEQGRPLGLAIPTLVEHLASPSPSKRHTKQLWLRHGAISPPRSAHLSTNIWGCTTTASSLAPSSAPQLDRSTAATVHQASSIPMLDTPTPPLADQTMQTLDARLLLLMMAVVAIISWACALAAMLVSQALARVVVDGVQTWCGARRWDTWLLFIKMQSIAVGYAVKELVDAEGVDTAFWISVQEITDACGCAGTAGAAGNEHSDEEDTDDDFVGLDHGQANGTADSSFDQRYQYDEALRRQE
ncbi:hypothetical protein SeMB42_g03907 [Synchytrium endobioticum]|uniref:Uncharacterized protein n=1 Tax=Synchytrium endobioticum TaxID=286115 RepID=A0A507DBA5_9FUNG|nr:hypothetical protein SeMB42_g03907 [Synchytrium endobioticum]TPX48190.1 hypothetical protein SeLEV6574_g02174 [Synchytrium endobioticum]